MPTILVVGATRGLGASIVQNYATDANNRVLATARTSSPPANSKRSLALAVIPRSPYEVGPHANIHLTM
jgi:NAD(P)-dependent dehydrogenase (short-subunit alcohol dehydrogenase family)